MTANAQNDERRRHIDGFVDSFVDVAKRERYRSFLFDSKKRSKFTDDLNHKVPARLVDKYIVAQPPSYLPETTAYLIADDSELDDCFVNATQALDQITNAYFGAIASISPGVLVAFKEEAPAKSLWLHRPNSQ